jgi:uncharacterized protein (DUF1330 family)
MAPGYVIAQISVTDPVAYREYVAAVTPVVEKFGGEYMVRGGRAETVEGTAPGERTVVIRFPSYPGGAGLVLQRRLRRNQEDAAGSLDQRADAGRGRMTARPGKRLTGQSEPGGKQ